MNIIKGRNGINIPVIRMTFGGVVWLYAVTGAAQSLPVPFEADYTATKFVYSAKAKIKLSRTGEYYKYAMRSAVHLGFFKQGEVYDCSILQVVGNRLYPVSYLHLKESDKSDNVQTRFDWTGKTISTILGDGRERKIKGVQYPTWDVLSIQLGLIMDVSSADRAGRSDYAVVDRGRLTSYQASVEEIESIDTAGDSVRSVKVKVRGPKRTNWFWFAKDFAWMPVRFEINDVVLQLASPPGQARREAEPADSGIPAC
jgi:hypothetical protein